MSIIARRDPPMMMAMGHALLAAISKQLQVLHMVYMRPLYHVIAINIRWQEERVPRVRLALLASSTRVAHARRA